MQEQDPDHNVRTPVGALATLTLLVSPRIVNELSILNRNLVKPLLSGHSRGRVTCDQAFFLNIRGEGMIAG